MAPMRSSNVMFASTYVPYCVLRPVDFAVLHSEPFSACVSACVCACFIACVTEWMATLLGHGPL